MSISNHSSANMKWSQSIIAVSTAVSIVTAAPLIDRQDSAITDGMSKLSALKSCKRIMLTWISWYLKLCSHLGASRGQILPWRPCQFHSKSVRRRWLRWNLLCQPQSRVQRWNDSCRLPHDSTKRWVSLPRLHPYPTKTFTAANAVPVEECTYAFGVTDVKTFLATASILEGVGVSAYLGAAADIMSKSYLTAAGSILTVEARHSSYLRSSLKESPFAQPFDTPLTMDDVYTLAAGFIVSCPDSSPKLPVKAFPKLMLDPATSMPVKAGNVVTLLTPDYTLQAASGVATIYAAFISVSGPSFAVATPVDGGFTVTIPEDFNGQSYAVLTSCNETVSDETTAAGPVLIEVRYFSQFE